MRRIIYLNNKSMDMKTKRNYLWIYPLTAFFLMFFLRGYEYLYCTQSTAFSFTAFDGNKMVDNFNIADEPGNSGFISEWSTTVKSSTSNLEELTYRPEYLQGTLTDIEGNVYQTVIIGEMQWMTENLRTAKFNDGTPIPTQLDDADWRKTTSGAYTIYPYDGLPGINSESEMLAAYGAFYNWYALLNNNLCPEGWHIPSNEEWAEMTGFIEAVSKINVGNQLKSCRQEGSPLGGRCSVSQHPRWNSHGSHHGNDKFGFSALPAGTFSSSGTYSQIGSHANWWSSTEGAAAYAWSWRIGFDSGNVFKFLNSKACGFSVRCVRRVE